MTDSASSSARRGRRMLYGLALVFLVAGLAGGIAAKRLLGRDRTPAYSDPAALFKYGSIGSEERYGVPWHIWRVMPTVCQKRLPRYFARSGWATLGLYFESPSAPRPIGVSYREKPIGLVGLNCAACHTATIREEGPDAPGFVLRAGSRNFDFEGYARFILGCIGSPQFTDENLLAEMKKDPSFSRWDELLYRRYVIPETRKRAALIRDDWQLLIGNNHLGPGPGRMDVPGVLAASLHLPATPGGLVSVRYPALFPAHRPEGARYGWDGSGPSALEEAKLFALAVGATPESLEMDTIRRVLDWADKRPVPAYPFAIQPSLARNGKLIFDRACAECHAPGGARTGRMLPVENVDTDPAAASRYTESLVAAINQLGAGGPNAIRGFSVGSGYLSRSLEGLWIRGPYLHAGTLGTVNDLLLPTSERPQRLAIGFDLMEKFRLGVWARGCNAGENGDCQRAERGGTVYNSTDAGNGNGGHVFGVELGESEKQALVEYLKTL